MKKKYTITTERGCNGQWIVVISGGALFTSEYNGAKTEIEIMIAALDDYMDILNSYEKHKGE